MGKSKIDIATFAGGCFWCTQHDFDQEQGVISTIVGFTGGTIPHPTYKQVCNGDTGHVEALQICFDPSIISYAKLLDIYWHTIDPSRKDGQFCDIGSQYQPVIFYHNEEQKQLAEQSKKELEHKKIVDCIEVDILPAATFYQAEEDHQKFYKKDPDRYTFYQSNSGRAQRLQQIWKDKR